MNSNAVIQIALFSLIIIAISVPLGLYMAKVFAGERTFPGSGTCARREVYLSAVRR